MCRRLEVVCIPRLIVLLLALAGFIYADGFNVNVTCLNGGSVIAGACVCAARFDGDQCQNEPCLNGGVQMNNTGPCYCPFGLTGRQCETTTYCAQTGKLLNGQCKCQAQWTGIFCSERKCYNGISVGTGGQCLCDLGYTGPFCDTEIACENGNFTTTNQCQCAPGFLPPNCSQCEPGLVYFGNLGSCLPADSQQGSWFSHIPWWYFLIVALCILLLTSLIIAAIAMKKYKQKNSRVGSAEPVMNGVGSDQPAQLHDQ